jgi:hypothetical protein
MFGAEPVRHPARPRARNPLRVARVRGNLAVQTHRRLERDEGAVVPTPVEIDTVHCLQRIDEFRLSGDVGVKQLYLHARLAQLLDALAVHFGVRVEHADHHAGDARLADSVCTRGRESVVAARLQRHIERCAACAFARLLQRVHFGVWRALVGVEPLAHQHAVLHDYRAHMRVGRREAALGKPNRAAHPLQVLLTQRHFCSLARVRAVVDSRRGSARSSPRTPRGALCGTAR